MKNKIDLKLKFITKKALFLKNNLINKCFNVKPYRPWGKKKVKWESWKLTSDKVVEFKPDDIGDFVFPETKVD